MKKIIPFAFLLITINAFGQPGTKNFIDQPYIEVTGKAEMEVAPDEIYLKIILDEEKIENRQSLEELEKAMIEKLTEIGVDVSNDLVVKDMLSNFKEYWLRGSKIHTVKEYQLTVHSAGVAGQVFVELEKLGISMISIEKVDHSEINKYRTEVKVQAIKAAKDKAGALSEAIDQSIGSAIYIQEMNYQIFRPMQEKSAGLSNIMIRGQSSIEDDTAQLPDIEFEKIMLEYSIMVRFALMEN